MSTQVCNPCAEAQVCLDNLDRYSLQEDSYFFVINCVPGFFCGGNNTMFLVCCDGTIEQTTFTAGMTAAQRQTAISALVSRCMMKEAFCVGDGGPGGGGDGTNGDTPGNDPNNPLQLYGNRPMSSTSFCADGSPFTYTVPPGLFIARTQALADAAALNYARTLSSSLKICLTGPLRTCCNNVAYSSTMVASGGVGGNFRWSVIGSLPTGLVAIPVGHNGLRIQGIPTTNGNYTFTVRATDSAGNFMSKVITIRVWGITDTALPDGFFNIDYTYLLPVTLGTPPYTFTLVSGAFPNGLSLATDGVISGVPLESGDFTIGVRVTDSLGRTCLKDLTLSIVGCPIPAIVGFTVPATASQEYANSEALFERIAIIQAQHKIATFSTNTNLGCLDLINFTGAPVLENRFLMNAETGWQYRGGVYDPTSGLIVAVVTKPATLDRVAFFDPTTGYVDSIELATTTVSTRRWYPVIMRGQPGVVAFFRASVQAALPAYIYIFDAVAKTILQFFTLTPPAGSIYGRGDFCYSCDLDEFYFCGTASPGNYRLFARSALDGSERAAFNVGATPLCTWVDSSGLIAIKRQNTIAELIQPSDGSVVLSKDLDDGSIALTVDFIHNIQFNFKLRSVMATIDFENPGNSTGVVCLNPATFASQGLTLAYADFESTSPFLLGSDDNNGEIFSQYDVSGVSLPFQQIIPVIT